MSARRSARSAPRERGAAESGPPAGPSDGRPALGSELARRRVIGSYGEGGSSPLVLCVGGIHGNEGSGVRALRRVVSRLEEERPDFRGQLIAVAGNLEALRAGRRFIDRDLNRGWSMRRVADALENPRTVEDLEQAALLEALVPPIRQAESDIYLLDLHTTSSVSPPFVTLSDRLETRTFAQQLGIPLVLGIEEEIDAMVDYLAGFGAVAIGVEAGQHDDPASVDLHEAALWIGLVAAGCLPAETDVVDLEACREALTEARQGLHDVFEVIYRRGIEAEDAYVTTPGFTNFTAVRAGRIVGHDVNGPVPVPMGGRLFLPLYQAQGDDGYFVVRPVRRVWLSISRLLRRLGAPKLLPLLPGVHRSTRRDDTFVVSRRIARWLVNEIFHLLGYRRVRETDRHIVFQGREPPLPE